METEILEVWWSGTLEREGKAPGLSTYDGRSSMYHSANWEQLERFEPGEINQVRAHGGSRHKTDAETEGRILQRLKFGWSYRQIAAEMGVLISTCRAIARRHGIDRRSWAGDGWRGQRKAVA